MKRTIYTAEQEAFRTAIRAFISKEIVPYFDRWEHGNLVDRTLFSKLGDLGHRLVGRNVELGEFCIL